MPFADFDAYVDALRLNIVADFQSTGIATRNVGRFSALPIVPTPATPTISVALDKTSDRAINTRVPNAGAGALRVLGALINPSGASGVALMLVDLLTISGGLSGAVAGEQSTNLPTAALPRYTSGEGVQAAIIAHSGIGSGATTVTAVYTNQAGTGSRVTTANDIGGLARDPGALIRLPMQAGDTGVRSVDSINIAASTGTAGNLGIVMYKPLALFMANDVEGSNVIDCVSTGRMVGQCAEVLADACLSLIVIMPSAQAAFGVILLGED